MTAATITRIIVPTVPDAILGRYNSGSKVCGFAPLTSHVRWRDMMVANNSTTNQFEWRPWSDEELDKLRAFYARATDRRSMQLGVFAASLGRDKANVCRKARALGLTNQRRGEGRTDRRMFKGDRAALRQHISEVRTEWLRTHEHPRGALGITHSDETRARISKKVCEARDRTTPAERSERARKAVWTRVERYGSASPEAVGVDVYSRAAGGRREDLGGQYFRSMWEANYARYLNWLVEQGEIQEWEYEADTFVFHGETRGAITYRPDFKVTERDGSVIYHEVKGWMDGPSKTRLRRMKKHYPDVQIVLIGEEEYKALSKWKGIIPNWETRRAKR